MRLHWLTQALVVHALAHERNTSQGEFRVPQTVLWLMHALPGPTDASEHSSHDSVFGADAMKLVMKDATGEMRTLAPTIVHVGSPNDVMPATRAPSAVCAIAGPPESPSQAPLSSVCEYWN